MRTLQGVVFLIHNREEKVENSADFSAAVTWWMSWGQFSQMLETSWFIFVTAENWVMGEHQCGWMFKKEQFLWAWIVKGLRINTSSREKFSFFLGSVCSWKMKRSLYRWKEILLNWGKLKKNTTTILWLIWWTICMYDSTYHKQE